MTKRLVPALITLTLFVSCQIEDDASPRPNEAFIKYYGDLRSYSAKDIEIVADGGEPSGFVVFGTVSNDGVNKDFYVLRTDLEGDTIKSATFSFSRSIEAIFQNDTISVLDINEDGSLDENDIVRGNATAGKIRVTDNGFLLVGSVTTESRSFLAVLLLNTELGLVTALIRVADESNDNLDLFGSDIIVLSSGGVLIVGKEEIDEGGFDSYLLKIEGTTFVFEKTIGVPGSGEDEEAIRVFEKPNGNLVLIGSGNSNSRLGENNGNNGQNAYFIELDPNGNPINRRYYGVDNADESNVSVYNDQVTNAIEVPSGYVIVGTSTTTQNESYGFAISLNSNGEYISGASLPSSSFINGGMGLETKFFGITQARDNDLIFVGQYDNFSFDGTVKSGEALFMKVDESIVPVPGNESHFGLTAGDDVFVDAVTLPDGSIVVVGNIDFGAGAKLISIVKLNDTGNLED